MSRLQTLCEGLLGALRAKVDGRTPSELSEVLSPVADVLDQYTIFSSGVAQGNFTGVAPATAATATSQVNVSNVLWRVWGVSGFLTMGAGDSAINSQLIVELVSASGVGITIAEQTHTAGFPARTTGSMFARPFWLPPQWSLRATAVLASAPSNNFTVSVRTLFNRIES